MSRRPVRSRASFATLSALPFLFLVIVFGGYAWIQVIQMAFAHIRVQHGQFVWSGAGFANFRAVLHNHAAWQSVLNTIVFATASVVLTVLLGLLLAVLVHRSTLFKAAARMLVIWPAVVAPVVVSLIWLLVLSPNIGLLNKILESLGLADQGWLGEELGAMLCIIIVDVWHWTPVAFLLLYSALLTIDAEILEASRCDGAREWQIFRHVQLPLLMPAIAATAFIRAVMCVKAFDEMYLLTGGGPNGATTLVSLHIRDVFFDQLDFGYGAAFSMLVVLLVAGAIGVAFLGRVTLRRQTAILGAGAA